MHNLQRPTMGLLSSAGLGGRLHSSAVGLIWLGLPTADLIWSGRQQCTQQHLPHQQASFNERLTYCWLNCTPGWCCSQANNLGWLLETWARAGGH